MGKKTITLPVAEEAAADVLVVGGGPSGIAAAIAAARNGAKTMLIEKEGYVGGMATAGLVGPFMTSYDNTGTRQVIKGIFDELVSRMEQENGAIHPSKIPAGTPYASFITKGHQNVTPFDPEVLKRVAEAMLLENGVELLLYTQFIDCTLESGAIKSVIAAKKQGLCEIFPRVVIDCSGDAFVASRSGVSVIKGREKDNAVQPATMFFRVANVDSARVSKSIEENKDLMGQPFFGAFSWLIREGKEKGDWNIDRDELGCYMAPGGKVWNMNTSRVQDVDAVNSESLTGASVEGRKQTVHILKFLKKYIPGFEEAFIVDTAPVVGVRESLHIKGEYTVTVDDLIACRSFDDDILLCSNSIDIHADDGSGGEYVTVDTWYGIPYRSLFSRSCTNLLVAGKTISATSEAAAAFRVMPPCYGIGQGAGTAAALAVSANKNPGEIDIKELQKNLINQGVFLNR
ncbi:FAD-dependent oxidoreductase [Breznakiella homolactica]|uniref:FAD-dependent oxidoreductase n=1 Tax=Breznakiella homolactica TaxID=2798577 RepID=A0A7T8BAS2_9SPIR|nr:FAD-dependent oxidoreductase [Breznakiella homolactica]QQO11029.1 FAD-dependent oxidoreductase [Breznakiella homolactica]